MKRILFCLLTLLCITSYADAKPIVYTVNYPLAYFAERIGGDAVTVEFPEIDGDPAFWDPERSDVQDFQNADLILLNGADYAKWIHKVSLPDSKMVNTSIAFKDQLVRVKNTTTHQHGPGGEHSHEGISFTTWIDPQLAILQAEEIEKVLSIRYPDDKELFHTNYQKLKKDLEQLDSTFENLFSQKPDLLFLASHPVYDYLAKRYQLNLKSVVWEADQPLTQSHRAQLNSILKNYPASVMIWESEPLEESKKHFSSLSIKNVTFNPTSNKPESGDYLDIMQKNVNSLREALKSLYL